MRDFMLDNDGVEGLVGDAHLLLLTHDRVGISDAADVLHSSVLVIWAEHVVQLREGVPVAKGLGVEVEGRLRDAENQFFVQVIYQGGSDEN
jgi:hypothetical protein